MYNYNKAYLKRSVYIVIGVAILILGTNLYIKWLSLTIVVSSGLIILYHLFVLSNLADMHIMDEARKEEEESALDPAKQPSSKRKQDITYYLVMCIFIALLIPLGFTGKLVENYLEWKPYIYDLLIYGGLISFLIAWIYYKRFKVVFHKKEKEYYVVLWMFLIPLLLIFHTTAWYNHYSPSPVIKKESASASDRGENTTHGNKYLFLEVDGRKIRFELPKYLFEKLKNEDSLMITVKKGALGYGFVDKFEIISR